MYGSYSKTEKNCSNLLRIASKYSPDSNGSILTEKFARFAIFKLKIVSNIEFFEYLEYKIDKICDFMLILQMCSCTIAVFTIFAD